MLVIRCGNQDFAVLFTHIYKEAFMYCENIVRLILLDWLNSIKFIFWKMLHGAVMYYLSLNCFLAVTAHMLMYVGQA